MCRTALALLAAAAMTAIACSSGSNASGGESGVDPNPAQPGKYEQTWTRSYSDTTCADWQDRMDSHQRWVAAADMLLGARRHDGDGDLPPDAMVTDFRSGVTDACSVSAAGTLSLAEVGALLYVTEKNRFGP